MEVTQDLTLNSLRINPSTDNTAIDALTVEGPVTMTKTLAVTGTTTLSSTLAVTGELSAPVVKAPVENGDANLTITEALHAGTIVMQTDVSDDRTYTVPDPSAAGVVYRLVGQGSGSAADGNNIIINTDGSVFFDGMITHHDTSDDDSAGPLNVGVWANGTTHDRLQINVPAGYDITLIAKSTTVWYVMGSVTSDTAPAFSAP